jgi:prepilin-type N-terminal cleavage/methylation domain-containing protein
MSIVTLSHRTTQIPRGFSLIELMVTVAIVMLVTGISLARYGSFNNSVLLKSQAYELALDIRQTQLYGVSVTGQSGNFDDPFGIVFSQEDNTYTLFQDDNENHTFDGGEQVGESYLIDPRFEIQQLRTSCGDASTASVVFERPDFDAMISAPECLSASSLTIVVAPTEDDTVTRSIEVLASGLISVQ